MLSARLQERPILFKRMHLSHTLANKTRRRTFYGEAFQFKPSRRCHQQSQPKVSRKNVPNLLWIPWWRSCCVRIARIFRSDEGRIQVSGAFLHFFIIVAISFPAKMRFGETSALPAALSLSICLSRCPPHSSHHGSSFCGTSLNSSTLSIHLSLPSTAHPPERLVQ